VPRIDGEGLQVGARERGFGAMRALERLERGLIPLDDSAKVRGGLPVRSWTTVVIVLPARASSFQVEITRGKPAPEDLARRRSEHASKCAREVGRIRKAGRVSRIRD
jgi:hypothetical protein